MANRWSAALVVPILCVALGGCGDGEGTGGVDGELGGTVLVFAAASLSDAFAEVEGAFEAEYPGVDVRLNPAGSSSLREQILQGAPADVFASADQSIMDEVTEAGEVHAEVQVFARNRLQIAVPAGNPAGVAGLDDFARPDLLIGLCAEGVPCGDFARDALARAGVEASIDTDEPDVRALSTKIGAGELDAGIVYVTDVIAAGDPIEGIDIPDDQNVVASYPIAALAGAPNPDAAAAFVDFVLSEQAQAILVSSGFTRP